ncbi:TIGR03111 family XrtG-associated glycosyltransferase [Lactiplantibacillus garii]
MGFWITWALVPIVVEIIPALVSGIRIFFRNLHRPKLEMPDKMPMISVIVPVYNSEATLFACIKSIHDSTYPNRLTQVILADNASTDNSFEVFNHAQNEFADMNMQLMHTEKGKASALNAALYAAIGTYIINIDSDGVLEKHALMNMVLNFENDYEVSALTGTILPQHQLIARGKRGLLQHNEYFEYAQAFLSGRVIESNSNHLFTMSGAFSAFRKEAVLNTFLYNTATIGEDTDMTFQIRDKLKRKVAICDNAIFYIEPISGLGELYTQRQRWQRGEVEVVHQQITELKFVDFFKSFLVRRMLIDHTFLFPRMIWMFASIALLFLRYSVVMMAMSYVIIYLLYILVGLLNYVCVLQLLWTFPQERQFYRRQWWVALTLPVYNLICAWIRFVGLINSMTQTSSWNSVKFGTEARGVRFVLKRDLKEFIRKWKSLK